MTRAVNIKAGTILTLSATIKGMPIPKVAWKKNDKEIPLKADIEVPQSVAIVKSLIPPEMTVDVIR